MGCLYSSDISKERDQNEKGSLPRINQVTTVKDIQVHSGMFISQKVTDPYAVYEIVEPIGEGAFGRVYKVKHKKTQILRAMKVINKGSMNLTKNQEEDMLNEIDLLKSLEHPNIVKVFEFYTSRKKIYIITEIVEGGELFDKITENSYLDEETTGKILGQVLSAVAFCHSNKIVHRDLKPENVLIEQNKADILVKIIDFGTSIKRSGKNMLNESIGTPYYMAPEVFEGKYDEKCDVWSLGVILYVMLSGMPPFEGANDTQIVKKILKGKPNYNLPAFQHLSPEVLEVMKEMMTFDYRERPTAVEILQRPFFRNERRRKSKIDPSVLNSVCNNFKNFNATQKFQQATISYLVHNLATKEDTEELRKAFVKLDANGDGKLTEEELLNGFSTILGEGEAKERVRQLMNIIDFDKDGYIEYEEFISATIDKEKLLTESNLQISFNLFDQDNSGEISVSEIKDMISSNNNVNEAVVQKIIDQIDQNGDGVISFKEFKELMNKCLHI